MFRQSASVQALRRADGVLGTAFVRRRAKLISVTIATNRDREKRGLNRKSRKSATNHANGVQNGKLCCLHRMSGMLLLGNRPAARLEN